MIDEFGVFGSDDRTLEVCRDALVIDPLLPELRLRIIDLQRLEAKAHEAGGVRVDPVPPQYPAKQPALIEQQQSDSAQEQALEPENGIHRVATGAAQALRSRAMTGAVSVSYTHLTLPTNREV